MSQQEQNHYPIEDVFRNNIFDMRKVQTSTDTLQIAPLNSIGVQRPSYLQVERFDTGLPTYQEVSRFPPRPNNYNYQQASDIQQLCMSNQMESISQLPHGQCMTPSAAHQSDSAYITHQSEMNSEMKPVTQPLQTCFTPGNETNPGQFLKDEAKSLFTTSGQNTTNASSEQKDQSDSHRSFEGSGHAFTPDVSPVDLKKIDEEYPPIHEFNCAVAVPNKKEMSTCIQAQEDLVIEKPSQSVGSTANFGSQSEPQHEQKSQNMKVELIPTGEVEQSDMQQEQQPEEDQARVETRGRKEMELDTYRQHVLGENTRNDVMIAELKEQKEQCGGQERQKLADSIAKVMREKTTRCRRLRDRERFLIQETIIENVMNIVVEQMTPTKVKKVTSDILCKRMAFIIRDACDKATELPKNLAPMYTSVKQLLKKKKR